MVNDEDQKNMSLIAQGFTLILLATITYILASWAGLIK